MIISPKADQALNLDIDIEEQKRKIAYQIWEDEGRPEGRAEEHWERACLIVMNLDAPASQNSGADSAETASPSWLARKEESAKVTPGITIIGPSESSPAASAETEIIRKKIAGRGG